MPLEFDNFIQHHIVIPLFFSFRNFKGKKYQQNVCEIFTLPRVSAHTDIALLFDGVEAFHEKTCKMYVQLILNCGYPS